MSWGWTPEAVGPIATSTGVLVALAGVVNATRLARRAEKAARRERTERQAAEDRRRKEEKDGQHRAQAELVAAWTKKTSVVRIDEGRPRIRYLVSIANRSNLPVTSVGILITPSQGVTEMPSLTKVFVIGPGEVFEADVALYGLDPYSNAVALWSLYYTDAAGRRWHRRADVLEPAVQADEDAELRSYMNGYDPAQEYFDTNQ